MLDKLFGTTQAAMARAMDGLSMRQRAIAENIANADTPHYQRLDVSFEGQMAQALGKTRSEVPLAVTSPMHLSLEGPQSLEDLRFGPQTVSDSTMRNDGNNVDVDTEMMRLAQTSLTYNALADLTKRKMSVLRSVIRGN